MIAINDDNEDYKHNKGKKEHDNNSGKIILQFKKLLTL